MKTLYCVICRKYRKLEKSTISYLLEKALVLSIICSKCKTEEGKQFLRKNNQRINWDIIDSWFNWKYIIIFKIWLKRAWVKKVKNIDETRNYFLQKIKHNKFTSRKHKKGLYNSKLYRTLSYFSFCNYWMYFNFFLLLFCLVFL